MMTGVCNAMTAMMTHHTKNESQFFLFGYQEVCRWTDIRTTVLCSRKKNYFFFLVFSLAISFLFIHWHDLRMTSQTFEVHVLFGLGEVRSSRNSWRDTAVVHCGRESSIFIAHRPFFSLSLSFPSNIIKSLATNHFCLFSFRLGGEWIFRVSRKIVHACKPRGLRFGTLL